MQGRARKLEHRATAMTIVVALQALAAAFFLADLAGDLASEPADGHLIVEGIAAVALLISVVLGAIQIRHLVLAARADEAAVAVARGALAQLVQLRFAQWHLTPAEADVALFALKGCDVAEIATLRGAAAGTVRAQLARIYAKAGVASHTALLALFVEELIDTSLLHAAGTEGEKTA
ncbi:helix-turn-helix transcriptional regulator [Alteraurantiacibacter buctensis]|uniref:Helix-turn-helix transcriptional regulator n=1 Tax=Alteraurantiacibacter buctensis TaxID=1503981 RepID=A0A844YW01_9SPHN|nr:helix-turn-helix transcriptional regulator [Alteraurantiacibacter buctensis]MXO70644.1 helix-turn-helix transcriptional regulator [Alteraurantiacibacter buctensis]